MATIRRILGCLRESGYDYTYTSERFNISKEWIGKYWAKHAEEFYGEDIAGNHNPFGRTTPRRLAKDLKEALTPAKPSREETVGVQALKHEMEASEANIIVVRKAANLKLEAIERLSDLMQYLDANTLLKCIDILDKIDAGPRGDLKDKKNSFLQLIQKQVIINKGDGNH